MFLQGFVGQPTNVSMGSGSPFNLRGGQMADLIVSELQGRFYENAYRGNLFSDGVSINALTANTITLVAATTPILGVWNPTTSPVNLAIQQAALTCVANNLTSGAGPGVFVWASSVGNGAISTGKAPFNRKTLANAGSQAKGMSFTALTGLTNNLVIIEEADFPTPSGLIYTTIGSVGLMPAFTAKQDFDGSLIVPPGGILALLNTTSCTTFSVAGRLMWAEVPI